MQHTHMRAKLAIMSHRVNVINQNCVAFQINWKMWTIIITSLPPPQKKSPFSVATMSSAILSLSFLACLLLIQLQTKVTLSCIHQTWLQKFSFSTNPSLLSSAMPSVSFCRNDSLISDRSAWQIMKYARTSLTRKSFLTNSVFSCRRTNVSTAMFTCWRPYTQRHTTFIETFFHRNLNFTYCSSLDILANRNRRIPVELSASR